MFWNKTCEQFSNKLWKPNAEPTMTNYKSRRKSINCDHPFVDFQFYKGELLKDIKFRKPDIIDNSEQKQQLYDKYYETEIIRYNKQLDKRTEALKKAKSKHKQKIKAIKSKKLNEKTIQLEKENLRYKAEIKKHNKKSTNYEKLMENSKNKHENNIEKISANKLKQKLNLLSKEKLRYDKEINGKKCNLDIINQEHDDKVVEILRLVIREDAFIRSRRSKLFLNDDQKELLQNWFSDATEIYNILVDRFHEVYDKYRAEYEDIFEFAKMLRNNKQFPTKKEACRNMFIDEFKKQYDMPHCVIADIIFEFVANVKSNLTCMEDGKKESFRFKYRTLDRDFMVLTIEKHYTSHKGFYPSKFGEIITDLDWSRVDADYKVIYDKYTKNYYVHVPTYIYPKEVVNNRKPVIAMDPGERIFQTGYGLDHFFHIGTTTRDFIKNKLKKIDAINSKCDLGFIKKHKCQRYCKRIHKKINNVVKELHYKLITYLCKNYDNIMTTTFTSRNVSSKDGNLNKWSKRVLGKLSHSRFKQRLFDKCQEYGCRYLEVDESYTSKTCSVCGTQNNVGSDRIYNCKVCDSSINRDVNGAINILIKNHKLIIEKGRRSE